MVLTTRAILFGLGLALLPWGPRLKTPAEQAAETAIRAYASVQMAACKTPRSPGGRGGCNDVKTAPELCARAQLIKELYLRARNQHEYARWRTSEQEVCARAGPRR
jgi:hypothetical protein